eukprot:TRINITY_DN15571_c0_g1_i1.p1 TRINITY_DN15571_c0_g1~~TRINITY_DN15571_c0_g1_i1.p1  ORF type:complete len:155 (+),score=15.07 TRINITY_DN15571_c0_g1_i1:64-465(+)
MVILRLAFLLLVCLPFVLGDCSAYSSNSTCQGNCGCSWLDCDGQQSCVASDMYSGIPNDWDSMKCKSASICFACVITNGGSWQAFSGCSTYEKGGPKVWVVIVIILAVIAVVAAGVLLYLRRRRAHHHSYEEA